MEHVHAQMEALRLELQGSRSELEERERSGRDDLERTLEQTREELGRVGAGLESLRHEDLRAALEGHDRPGGGIEAAAASNDTDELRAELEATRTRVAALDEALSSARDGGARRLSWRARGRRASVGGGAACLRRPRGGASSHPDGHVRAARGVGVAGRTRPRGGLREQLGAAAARIDQLERGVGLAAGAAQEAPWPTIRARSFSRPSSAFPGADRRAGERDHPAGRAG